MRSPRRQQPHPTCHRLPRNKFAQKAEALLSLLQRKLAGVGLLVIGLLLLATGLTFSYRGLTVLGAVLLVAGAALLALKIVRRNRSLSNT
jgi:uncharacterized membrane protein HdeD (DUF308 family)